METGVFEGKWGLVDGRQGVRRWVAAAVGAGLAVLELALVRLAGPPGRQVEVLRRLGEVGADPLASLLALLALAAEGLAAYLLAVLGLRLLASVPGAVGRLAAGATVLAAPATVRRALDLLLGGALLARRPSPPSPPERPPLPRRRLPAGWTRRPRPSPPERPPLAGGRRSRPAACRLAAGANRCGVVGGRAPLPWLAVVRPDPDLIHCGTRLLVLPYRPDRR